MQRRDQSAVDGGREYWEKQLELGGISGAN